MTLEALDDPRSGGHINLSAAHAELVSHRRHRLATRKDDFRRIPEGEELPPDIYGWTLIEALRRGEITGCVLKGETLIPIPRELWWSEILLQIDDGELQLIFFGAKSAHRLFQRLGTDMPVGFPDGQVLLVECDFRRWLRRFKTEANELEAKNDEEDMKVVLIKLYAPGNNDQPRTKENAKCLVKERLRLKHMNGRAFDRAWEKMTKELGREDLRKPGPRLKGKVAT